MFKKWIEKYLEACKDHELTGKNHWEYLWVPVLILGVSISIIRLVTKLVTRK